MGTIILSWFVFSPLAYGSDFGSKERCERLRILGNWKFTCQRQDLPWARPHSSRAVSDEISAKGIEQDSDVPHFYADDDNYFDGVDGDVDEHHDSEQEHHKEDALPEPSEEQKMIQSAEARAKEILAKNALVAEKEALEHRQRILEERLLAQERLLEEQRIIQENVQREREEAQRRQEQGQQQQEQQHQEDVQYEEQRQKVLKAMADKHAENRGAQHVVSDETREADSST